MRLVVAFHEESESGDCCDSDNDLTSALHWQSALLIESNCSLLLCLKPFLQPIVELKAARVELPVMQCGMRSWVMSK
jgi:hypothetical protein